MESVIKEISQLNTDVLIINSGLWDITRYKNNMQEYASRLERLCLQLRAFLPQKCLVIWRSTLPVNELWIRGGFMTYGAKWGPHGAINDINIANSIADQIMLQWGYQVFNMVPDFWTLEGLEVDGIHWSGQAHRKMTNIFLHSFYSTHFLGHGLVAFVPVLPSAVPFRLY